MAAAESLGRESNSRLPEDLTLIRGWAMRLGAWLSADKPPNSCSWMLFRPDRLTADALMRLSVRSPHIVKQIDDAVDWADMWLDRLSKGDEVEESLADAMEVLHHLIGAGASIIEQIQAPNTPAREDSSGADWQDVKAHLERLCNQGEHYTSQRILAGRLNCSLTTVNKAICKSSKLQDWMGQKRKSRGSPSVTGLSEVIADNARQSREADPADTLDDNDVDKAMARLIEQAQPKECPKLKALDAEGRRALAHAYYAHNLDAEPSPLEDDPPGRRPRRVRQHKQV